jgi:hypothetical protein
MKYLKLFENYLDDCKLLVTKSKYGWDCRFKCSTGEGKALIMDKSSDLKNLPNMKDGEMYLFGINTSPDNSGIGRKFLLEIFNYFNLDMVYLPSDENHPVWNKIATKFDTNYKLGDKDMVLFTLSKKQLLDK